MREWKYPLLFAVMTAVSAVPLVAGEVSVGLPGVLLFGVGGIAYVGITRSGSGTAEDASRDGTHYGSLPGLSRYTTAPGGLVFSQSTVATGFGLLGSAAFVVAGCFLVMTSAPAAVLAGVLAVAFFGLTLVVSAKALLCRGGIVLVPDGVYLRTPAGNAWVRWEDLAQVRAGDGVQFLATSPERMVLTGINRALQGVNRRRFGMDVAFPSQFLRSPAGVVVDTIAGALGDPVSRPALADPTRRRAQ